VVIARLILVYTQKIILQIVAVFGLAHIVRKVIVQHPHESNDPSDVVQLVIYRLFTDSIIVNVKLSMYLTKHRFMKYWGIVL
jgi:hypothetical protein